MPTSAATTVGYHYPAGRSRAELRTLIARAFGGFWRGKATGNGSTTTLLDSRLTRYANDFWIGAQIWVEYKSASAAGYVSYVTDFVAASGTLTFAPAMSQATATGDDYQLFRYVTKEEIEDALNEVCKGGTAHHQLTPNTDLDLDYSLNDISTLHRPAQVLGVYRQSGADDDAQPVPVHHWTLENNAGLLTLRLPYAPTSDDEVWVVYEIGEGGLVHDDDRTTLPADVVRARAVVWLLENMLINQDEQGLAKYGQLLRYWQEQKQIVEQALPRPARFARTYPWSDPGQATDQPWAAAGLQDKYQ